MAPIILNGKALADKKKDSIKQTVTNFYKTYRRTIKLAVILVGDDPASKVYVRHKQSACQTVEIASEMIELSQDIEEQVLVDKINQLNQDEAVDGILVQLPLPQHINKDRILQTIAVDKDVDGFHPFNTGLLAQGHPTFRPCTPKGVIELLTAYDIVMAKKHAVIIGTSNIVGRPMAMELLLQNATPTLCHRKTLDLQYHIEHADIIISATGNRTAVNSDWFKPGQVIVDVGIHRLENGSLCGDIDFNAAIGKDIAAITPVPGGVGPMTVISLLENTLQAALMHQKGA